MNNALIGHSGFVGQTLKKQTEFKHFFRSTDIDSICNNTYDIVVCAGAPAQKWIANKNPDSDKQKIDDLIGHLSTVNCNLFILISTVDVFKTPDNVDEATAIDTNNLHAYGYNRYRLEEFVKSHFNKHLIIRLPGLVGPGLKKNVIYDFLNNNNIDAIESRNVFQFYPMVNLWRDIQIAIQNDLSLIHLTATPISVSDVAKQGFNINFNNQLDHPTIAYNFKSRHAQLFSNTENYQYSKEETLLAIRSYAQSEPVSIKE